MNGSRKMHLIVVGRREQGHLSLRIAVNHVEIVRDVTAQNGKVTAGRVREDAEWAIHEYLFFIVAHEGQTSLDKNTADFPSDTSQFRRLSGGQSEGGKQ
jgi:cephalosporin-C deacetylase-like acetyl esterase